jgi:hypothetical protein
MISRRSLLAEAKRKLIVGKHLRIFCDALVIASAANTVRIGIMCNQA